MEVVFTHNVIKPGLEQLWKTIVINRKYFPDAPVYVSYFDNESKVTPKSPIENVYIKHFGENKGHKLGCLSGQILANKMAFENETDGKVLIFSHDDVYIDNIAQANTYIHDAWKHSSDIIVRHPDWFSSKNYIMFDTLLINMNPRTREFFMNLDVPKTIEDIPKDEREHLSPECYFGEKLNKTDLKKRVITYTLEETTWGVQNHGFYHIPGRKKYGKK